MTSQLVPLQDDVVPAWKEDFMMTSAFDMNRMSHVNPLQSTPYVNEFKILDQESYPLNAPRYEGIKQDYTDSDTKLKKNCKRISYPIEVDKSSATSTVGICAKSKKIKKNKPAKVVAQKTAGSNTK